MGRGPGKGSNSIVIAAAVALLMAFASDALALSESPAGEPSPAASAAPAPAKPAAPSGAPATKIVPSDETEPAAAPSEAGAAAGAPAEAKKPRVHHRAAAPLEVEPTNARLRVTKDEWIYAAPSNTSRKIERATVGKFVNVSGSTKYYLQVQLKSGQTGYIPPSSVELVKPVDKIFTLTQDAAVLQAPNKWAKKLAEVHRPHAVHVIGLALDYMQIRMKSGLTGFIPVTALQ